MDKIRLVVLGGESVHEFDFNNFKKHFLPGTIMINGYGPTESTITLQKFLNHYTEVNTKNIPIGIPVSETKIYLLNWKDKEVGLYEEGEIVYKSDYLSLGYFNDVKQTESVFTEDPITKVGRVYRSGDIG